MAFKMKGFEPHNMYKTKKANTHKDHLDLEKKGYDHNPYKKASSFTKTNGDDKKKIAENQDPGSGRSQVDELKYDMKHAQEQIDEAKSNLKNNPHEKGTDDYNKYMSDNNRKLSNLTQALNKQKKDYLRFLSEKKMLPKP